MAIDMGTAQGHLDIDISKFIAGMEMAQRKAQETAQNTEKSFNSRLSAAGQTLQSVGGSLTKGLTLPLVGAAAAGLKVGSDFESGMSQVAGVLQITDKTSSEFQLLRDTAIDLGAKTAFSSGEVADAMTEMAKAGWNSSQIIDGMGGVLDAAAASGEGLSTVATICADAVTGFGLEAKDSTRIADLLAHAANAGTIDIADLGETFKYVAPMAQSMGLSIEDVTTATTAMSMAGIKGSQAGTSLRRMLTNLVKPSDSVQQAMDELGISITNDDGSFKSLDEIVGVLRKSFDGLTDEQKAYYAATIAGADGQSGLLALLNLSEDEYSQLSEEMNNCGGEAKQTAEIMQDNLKSKVEQLGGALESLAIRLSDLVIPWLTRFIEKITSVVEWFTNLDAGTQKIILVIAGIAAAIGPVLVVVGKVMTAIAGISESVGAVKNVFSVFGSSATKIFDLLLHPITALRMGFINVQGAASTALGGIATALGIPAAAAAALVAAIAAIVGAFVYLWNTNEDFRNKIIEVWNGLVAKFNEFTQGIVDKINELGFNFESITDVIMAAWQGLCDFLAPIFIAAWEIIASTLSGVMDIISNIIDIFVAVTKGDWERVWNDIGNIFKTVWDWICNILNSVLGIFGTTLEGAINAIAEWWTNTWNGIKDFFVNIWNGIKQFFVDTWNNVLNFFINIGNSIVNAVQTFLTNVFNFFSQLPTNIANFITSAWNAVVEWVANMINKAIELGSMFLKSVIDFFSQLPYNIGYFIGYALASVVVWVRDMINKAIELGTQFLQNIINFFVQLPTNIAAFITDVWNQVTTWATNMWNKATELGQNFLNNIVNFFSQLPTRVAAYIGDVWNRVTTWAVNMWNKAREMASSFLNNVVNFFSQLPSRVAAYINDTWNRVASWAANMWNKASEMGRNFINNVSSTISSLPSTIMGFANNAVSQLGSWVSSMGSRGREAMNNLINSAMNAAAGIAGRFVSVGSDIVSGVWRGIQNAVGWFTSSVKSFFSGIVDGAKSALGIHSPSRVFAKEVGYWIPLGAAEGVEDGAVKAGKTIQDAFDDMLDVSTNMAILDPSQVLTFAQTLKHVYSDLKQFFIDVNRSMYDAVYGMVQIVGGAMTGNGLGYVGYGGFAPNPSSSVYTRRVDDSGNASVGSGDTFVFYSNRSIDEIEAARQMRKTKQDMAEGF